MLSSLYIKNYALIDELDVTFDKGFTIITGETGAGKSILLGGLALVLGKRANSSQVKNKAKKCVVEASFYVAKYNLVPLFNNLDLDYDDQTIIRREILPSGKSRAFINDTPVSLDNLTQLSEHLIDIHSQHQTQQLTQDNYQFQVIDALADNKVLLQEYHNELKQYNAFRDQIEELQASKIEMIKEYDYNLFLYNELNEIALETMDLEDLEQQYEGLNNVEVIGEQLHATKMILETEELGLVDQLNTIKLHLSRIASYGKAYEDLRARVVSVALELDDLGLEIDDLTSKLSADPRELERINNQLKVLHNLFQKHGVDQIEGLLEIKNELSEKVSNTDALEDQIAEKKKEVLIRHNALQKKAAEISTRRKNAIPVLISNLEKLLADLGMPNAKFNIELSRIDTFTSNGSDRLSFLFTANKGSRFSDLKTAASGGELSRIMLAIKSILAEYIQLPSIIFDEIDTGVSGEIAHKMGGIMKAMSNSMQVFTITHLPQVAAQGKTHFKVFKEDKANSTIININQLDEKQRLKEIAQMLGGYELTDSAMAHAKQLLN